MTKLTHLDHTGAARMVDVAGKGDTLREAAARGRITMSSDALALVRDATTRKGDILAVARVAGIMAAKRTAEFIPLCHSLSLSFVAVDFAIEEGAVSVTAQTRATGPTGVEMEALVAVTTALLTIYDMAKAVDREMTIEAVDLVRKSGGRSGSWTKAT